MSREIGESKKKKKRKHKGDKLDNVTFKPTGQKWRILKSQANQNYTDQY